MDHPLPLSVAIITLNEEENLQRCLKSLQGIASEIIIIDSGSTDKTSSIALQYGATFEFNQWPGYIAQKNVALNRCLQPWILCLDADEALSQELVNSIRNLFAQGEPRFEGYVLNRRNWYLGRWIWHAWYPEWRLRLVKRNYGIWSGLDPHDKLEVRGNTIRIEGDLLHYPFVDLQHHLYSTISHAHTMANSYARLGRKFHWYHLFFSPWLEFFKRLVIKQSWRDGWRGWLIATVKVVNVYAKYAFLLERKIKTKA